MLGEALAPQWAVHRVRLVVSSAGKEETFEARSEGPRWSSQYSSSKMTTPWQHAAASTAAFQGGLRLVLPLELGEEVGELAIWYGSALPILEEPTYLASLARLVEVALDNQRLVKRVADLSRRAHIENRELREALEDLSGGSEIIARSPQMLEVMDRVAMVARYDTSVLIHGASGTGKERISREIHRRSSRSRKSFVQVNCGAIPSQLIESELFGHEEGAFTGASRCHRGVFEQAHQGVLLLDEVGELPLGAQVKLLRVLQEQRIRRVGAESEIDIDVRVVAATNRNLAKMVRKGEFREDLYFRLSVFPIEIPALRERPEDIAPLVSHLLAQLSEKLGTKVPAISDIDLDRLKAHAWPGNTRELANVLEAAIILGRGRTLELPREFRLVPPAASTEPVKTPLPLSAVIRGAIEDALRSTRGKLYGADGAAALLGLHPATLQSKMRKLGVVRNDFLARRS